MKEQTNKKRKERINGWTAGQRDGGTDDRTKDNNYNNSVDYSCSDLCMKYNKYNKYFCLYQVLKPGGLLFFRDYGLYDHAMLRFNPANKLANNFYVRQDGTRAYYFSKGK